MSRPSAQDHARAARQVDDARQARGLSVRELARLAGVHYDTVRDLLNGETWPRDRSRQGIERALGWPPGRIAALAEGRAQQPEPEPEPAPSPPDTLDLSVLTLSERYEVLALYHRLLERRGP
jgi:transcriptional regulator with XRE-family HTH domain